MKRKIRTFEEAIPEEKKIHKNDIIYNQENNIQSKQVKRDLNYNPYKPISRPNDYTLNEWMHGTDTGKVANRVETRLNISNPKDALEQEADKVANDVLTMKDTKISSIAKNNIHLKESSTGKQVNANLENELSKLSGGQPLSKSDKSFFETRMNTNFSSVKIYNNEHAHKLAKSLNAKAFTRGTDIVFAKGEYNTKSSEGKKLLAHEIAHVVQGGIGIKRKQEYRKDKQNQASIPQMEKIIIIPEIPTYQYTDNWQDWLAMVDNSIINILNGGINTVNGLSSETKYIYDHGIVNYSKGAYLSYKHLAGVISKAIENEYNYITKTPISEQFKNTIEAYKNPQFWETYFTMIGSAVLMKKVGTVFKGKLPRVSGKIGNKIKIKKTIKKFDNLVNGKIKSKRWTLKKLDEYLLNFDHPIGKTKAKWFNEALGFNKRNMRDLAQQIVFDKKQAIPTLLTEYGQKYNQVIKIIGANGKKINVTFAWIMTKDGVVRLITAIPTKR